MEDMDEVKEGPAIMNDGVVAIKGKKKSLVPS
jgi:hypothetical protein